LPAAATPWTPQSEHHRNADEKTIVVPRVVKETIECVRSGPTVPVLSVPSTACRLI
jgi:hypothetical protein